MEDAHEVPLTPYRNTRLPGEEFTGSLHSLRIYKLLTVVRMKETVYWGEGHSH